jgi:hypothetical protein
MQLFTSNLKPVLKEKICQLDNRTATLSEIQLAQGPLRQGFINHQHISSRFLNADQGSISSTFYEQLLCQYSYANPTGIQHIA